MTATATSFQLLFAEVCVFPNVIHASHCADVHGALLQAYGDAVVEEAPIFAISNYDVTFFCRQHLSEVGDKRIWAPHPLHGTRPHCPLVQLGCISWL